MKKRGISILLILVMMFSYIPLVTVSALASEYTAPTIVVGSKHTGAGSTVEVNLEVENNPGIAGAKITLSYAPELTLIAAESGETFSELDYTKPSSFASPCNFNWDSENAEVTENGVLLKLTFVVSEDAQLNENLDVEISYRYGDIYNKELESLDFDTVNGSITIIDYTPGDVNDDGSINGKDVTLLRRFNADGYDVNINCSAANVNDDGTINGKDVTLVRRYIAGGYGVELLPETPKCDHSMTATEAVDATCTENGNIAYWYCSLCEKYFSDEEGTAEITVVDTVVEKYGHTPVVDAAVAPTYTSTGLTEGSHCLVCGEVLVKQEILPALQKETYSITYNVANGDTYLAGLEIENKNPETYISEEGLQLKNLSVNGYKFLGWYDLPSGSNAEIVKTIPVGAKGEYELYAHWEKEEYEVEFEFPTQFNADLVSLEKVTYTVDKGVVLPTPQLEGYIFAGWSDEEGNIIKKIPVGTTGSKQYTANWLSKRNQAWTKQELDDPIIIEDDKSNVILFTYEIGEIRNVPVYEIENFGYVNANGVSKTVTKTFSTTVSESLMESYTNTVSNSTVNSYGWTLSNSWSDSTSIDEEWCETQGMTKEEAESYSKSDTDGWYVSSGSSGSTTTQTLNTVDSYDLKTNTTNDTKGGGTSSSNTHASSLSNSVTVDVGLEVETKASVNANLGISDDLGVGGSLEQSVSGSLGVSDTFTGSNSDSNTNSSNSNYSFSSGESAQGGSVSHTGTNTTSNSSWNSESGYNGSSTVTTNSALSKAISESISNKYGYGKTYIANSGETSTQGLTSTESSSDSYSSSVTYSTITSEEQTISYTTSNTISGYHRWIMVDTAHVFAVVGYDIATSSYFVNTYTVMEDNLKPYEDYSCSSGNYDDNQNSYIGFEVPYDIITSYVGNRVGQSDGLEVNSSGVITAYSGTDDYVVIPEYKVIDNQDGTKKVIKITGISENAFKGNTNITGVLMSSFIDEIPNNAFKGCTSLKEVQSCVSSIGNEAFSGCTSMKAVQLGYGITSIGDNAFDSVEDITLYAINKDVINAIVGSGAKNITVYITDTCESIDGTTLEIPATTELFTFNGSGKTYTDLCIASDATKTVINRAVFVSTGKTPLQTSSSEIEFQEVTVNAPGIGLICTAEASKLNLYGESYINSDTENAVLCKNVTLGKIKDDYFSQLNVSGNVLVCGEIENESYLSVENGEIIYIDNETFDKYKQGTINVTFDANGGSVSETSKTVYYGQSYGTLPTPTRTNYTFNGWFTAASGGTKITSDTTVNALVNQTLYAQWTKKTYTVSFNANGGNVSSSSKVVEAGGTYGTLPTPTKTGWTFKGWYTATSGGTQITADSTVNLTGAQTLYARWQVNSYTVSWSNGTGYTITINRTSSPNAGAATGNISSGSKIYYGDTISVTYTAATGYSITSSGIKSATVTGNVTSSHIYAKASPNSYTYTILYRSTNGTDLGSSSATYKYGTTNTITAPAKTGYSTPSAQSVAWNATSKTITFYYTPIGVTTEQNVASGSWWWKSNYTYLNYSANIQYQNRTANSVQVRVVWTNTFTRTSGRYGYGQYFNATIGGVGTGDCLIANSSKWSSTATGTDSALAYSGWVTVPVSATQTSVSMTSSWWDQNSKSGSWSATFAIPTY